MKRLVGTSGETWQVYGAGGLLLAEYAPNASPSQPQREYGYRGGELLVTAAPAAEASGAGPIKNMALASNGGVATASSTHAVYSLSALNDGDRKGPGYGGVWGDNSSNAYPDWVQLDFGVSKAVAEVSLFSVQNNGFTNSVEPTAVMTGSQYVVTSFEVQYWTGTQWTTVSGGNVNGNNKVWRRVVFPEVTTSKVRVRVNGVAGDDRSNVAEVEAWGPGGGAADVRWIVSDQLGTPRMVVDRTGSLSGVTRHDYLPFGEELGGDTTFRTPARGYAADGIRQHFTGYERDAEISLDYTQARYYSSVQGRFMSPDPLHASGRAAQPQSWNRYSYVLNNPLRLVDPTGRHLSDSPYEHPLKTHVVNGVHAHVLTQG